MTLETATVHTEWPLFNLEMVDTAWQAALPLRTAVAAPLRLWQEQRLPEHRFKEALCNLASDMDCDIRVAHYPPGCSKYNPIEHRMFCHVTRSLQGVVLKTIDVARRFMGRTHTKAGLHVVAEITRRMYDKGLRASELFLAESPIRFETLLPKLNYTTVDFGPITGIRVREVIFRPALRDSKVLIRSSRHDT